MNKVALIALLTGLVPAAAAQRSPAPPGFTGLPAASHATFGHPAGSSGFLPVFLDSGYPGYFSSPGYPAAPQPPVIVVETATLPPAAVERAPTPVQPLLIELQGNTYVQLSGEKETSILRIEEEKPSKRFQTRTVEITPSPHGDQKLSTLLLFRDGHQEEVSSYTIAGGVLYLGDDGHANGSWSRKIELSSLDWPGTLKSNQSRGIQFRLPTAPNEVIVGP
jgi:hypothetical protein